MSTWLQAGRENGGISAGLHPEYGSILFLFISQLELFQKNCSELVAQCRQKLSRWQILISIVVQNVHVRTSQEASPPILVQLQLRGLKWAEMEISLLQLKNANNKVAANRVRVFVALKRGLHGGSGAHVLLGYETQKLCIWIISSAQRGSLLRPSS